MYSGKKTHLAVLLFKWQNHSDSLPQKALCMKVTCWRVSGLYKKDL